MTCHGPDCTHKAQRGALCWGHVWQMRHGKPLRPLAPRKQSRTQRMQAAALAYAEAEDDESYARALARLRMAARPVPRCSCGRRAYLKGRCYRCFRVVGSVARIDSTRTPMLIACAISSPR